MTEQYWQRYKVQLQSDPFYSDDPFWTNVRKDISRRDAPKHHLELYSYCKTDNPFIRLCFKSDKSKIHPISPKTPFQN